MDTDVIKSFLVGLGFGVDDAALAKFNKAIASATLKVSALYGATQLAAAALMKTISGISEGFEAMGYEYRIISPMINKTLLMRQELLRAYRAAGINITSVIRDAVRLNFSITRTQYAFQAIYRSVASKFFPLLTRQSDIFRTFLYANMPKIQRVMAAFVDSIFTAFAATLRLGERLWSILNRVYDFFVALDRQTNGWSTIVLGLLAAWKLLNLEFLATPLGMIITGFIALLALWDDFKTYEEGGISLIDWGPYIPVLKQVGVIFDNLAETVSGLAETLRGIVTMKWEPFSDGLNRVARAFLNISNAMDAMVRSFNVPIVNKILEFRDRTDQAAFRAWDYLKNFGGSGVPQPGDANFMGPLLPSQGAGGVNQSVSQQTTINVNGTADAAAVGKNVVNQQGQVNSNLSRNLRGAVR